MPVGVGDLDGLTTRAPAIRNTGADTEAKSQSTSSSPCRKYAGSASASASWGPGRRCPRTTSHPTDPRNRTRPITPVSVRNWRGRAVRLDRLVEVRRPVAEIRDLEAAGAGALERRLLEPFPRLLPPRPAEVAAGRDEAAGRVRQLRRRTTR